MTIATNNGFVIGQKYVVSKDVDGERHHKFNTGDVLEFIFDDGSLNPHFRRVSDKATAYVNIKRLTPLEPVPEEAVEKVTYNVEVNKDNTAIFVRKQLSLEQIKRILDIVGE
jgi:hypothetical protein